ncbi:MAG: diguanylate cyclase [Deltaproteobacteria bacterium]|nr:diguanylate cyclase [Deltaproteobacteria bacterium]
MKILIVEDSAPIRAEIKRTIGEASLGAECVEAENGVEALKALMQTPVDLVLCDVQMPQMDGFQFLRVFRARADNALVPVIMLTGRDAADEKIFGLEVGASDYVTKPFVAAELIARVKVQLKLKTLQDDLKRANEQLKVLSITDHLTSLFNRRHFSEVLQGEFKRSQRYKHALSLAMLDLDHFKQVNDKHGHTAGDLVLTDFANLLRTSFRNTDSIARYGGEEFVVLLPHTSASDAVKAVEKVRAQLQTIGLGLLPKGSASFSAGVAMYPSDVVNSTDTLVSAADAALYKAKSAGRNRVVSA